MEELINLINIDFDESRNAIFKVSNREFKLNAYESRILSKIDMDNAYCYYCEFNPTIEEFFINVKLELLYK